MNAFPSSGPGHLILHFAILRYAGEHKTCDLAALIRVEDLGTTVRPRFLQAAAQKPASIVFEWQGKTFESSSLSVRPDTDRSLGLRVALSHQLADDCVQFLSSAWLAALAASLPWENVPALPSIACRF
jgi:hypothetical protein